MDAEDRWIAAIGGDPKEECRIAFDLLRWYYKDQSPGQLQYEETFQRISRVLRAEIQRIGYGKDLNISTE